MLQLIIPEKEYFNEITQEFTFQKKQVLVLEHSLISISKWESKWKKPFLDTTTRSVEESIDYIRCMTMNSNVDPEAYLRLTQEHFNQVSQYIDDKMTATWFNEKNNKKSGRSQVVTSELIYYWMIAFQIPFECQKWHLNRLLTLIHICELKNTPSKKMSKKDIYAHNRSLNEARKRAFGTKG